MNKEELELAKKIAEIEGIELSDEPSDLTGCYSTMNDPYIYYNPFDWSILGPLMVKYKVSIHHTLSYVFITQGWSDIEVEFETKEDIPMAILKCIIDSNEQ